MFTPHTEEDVKIMLQKIGVGSVQELFAQVPSRFLNPDLKLPAALTEAELSHHVHELARKNKTQLNFIGAGCEEHFIPAAVDALSSRGEFLTAYTPYQAEASQGTLQTIYEFQSSICALFGMDVCNASHYDGATALAEAVLASVRIKGRKEVLVSQGLHPHYKEVLQTYTRHQNITLHEVPLTKDGVLDQSSLQKQLSDKTACFVLPTPNFLGHLEPAAAISETVHQAGSLLVALVNPLALALTQTPGEYSADFAVAEGQMLGNAMNFGGPGLGLFTCKKEFVRQVPGRIVGMAKDKSGKRSFVLTLQAREQHIRRERAASNICSNEALCALRAVIYLTLLGPKGLQEVAELNLEKAHRLADLVSKVPGFQVNKQVPFFNEFVLQCPKPAAEVIAAMAAKGINAGFDLGVLCPVMKNALLVCVTETKTEADLQAYVQALGGI